MNALDIKRIREQLGLSQEKMAEMLGVHARTIQNWESGTKIPKSKDAILCNLAEGYNLHHDEIPQQKLDLSKSVLIDRDVLKTIMSQQETIASQQQTIQQMLDMLAKRGAQREDPAGCVGAAGA